MAVKCTRWIPSEILQLPRGHDSFKEAVSMLKEILCSLVRVSFSCGNFLLAVTHIVICINLLLCACVVNVECIVYCVFADIECAAVIAVTTKTRNLLSINIL